MQYFGFGIINPAQDIRLVGIIFLVMIAIIPMISLEFEAKVSD